MKGFSTILILLLALTSLAQKPSASVSKITTDAHSLSETQKALATTRLEKEAAEREVHFYEMMHAQAKSEAALAHTDVQTTLSVSMGIVAGVIALLLVTQYLTNVSINKGMLDNFKNELQKEANKEATRLRSEMQAINDTLASSRRELIEQLNTGLVSNSATLDAAIKEGLDGMRGEVVHEVSIKMEIADLRKAADYETLGKIYEKTPAEMAIIVRNHDESLQLAEKINNYIGKGSPVNELVNELIERLKNENEIEHEISKAAYGLIGGNFIQQVFPKSLQEKLREVVSSKRLYFIDRRLRMIRRY